MAAPRVTLEQWQALAAVVDRGSYARAAAALHKSQSSVTYAVQQLESQLGVKAFRLAGRKAVLTPTGELLYRRARQLLEEASALEQALRTTERETAERLSARMVSRAIALEGTCTGEHGIGLHKQGFLVDETGASAVAMMRANWPTLLPPISTRCARHFCRACLRPLRAIRRAASRTPSAPWAIVTVLASLRVQAPSSKRAVDAVVRVSNKPSGVLR